MVPEGVPRYLLEHPVRQCESFAGHCSLPGHLCHSELRLAVQSARLRHDLRGVLGALHAHSDQLPGERWTGELHTGQEAGQQEGGPIERQ